MPKVFPNGFIDSLQGVAGFEKDAFVSVHESPQQVTSLRLNPLKPLPAAAELPLQAVVPWCSTGWYLLERPSFTLDPVFHGGAYYVQEASSMFLDYVVREIYKDAPYPERVLDLCAAPGGKSTLLAAALSQSFIVSNEVSRTRVSVLSENISKWGSDNVIVTNNDPADFKNLHGYFDLLIADAPCSGSGLFRKDPLAVDEWSEANVEMCSFRQKRILADAIDALHEGGYLLYSTCSYSRQENEDMCDWIMENFQFNPVKIETNDSWGITESFSEKHSAPGYRFYPDKVKGEGFFIACFQQAKNIEKRCNNTAKLAVAGKQVRTIAEPFLRNQNEYLLFTQKEIIIAIPKKWQEEVATISAVLNVRKSGVAVGTVKGKDFIPHHELALTHLLADDVPSIDLLKEEALKYLRRQDMTINTLQKGWTVCKYADTNIGWIKVLPNRVNNYYPVNWRILKT